MNKQPEITDATREAFVQAYCKLSYGSGGKKFTIKNITDLAGYNRTTFYRYFIDVIDVNDYLERQMISEILKNIRLHVIDGAFDNTFYKVFLDVYHKHKMELTFLISEEHRTHFIESIKNEIFPMFTKLYKLDESDMRMNYVMTIYLSGVFSALGKWIENPENMSEEQMLDIIRNLFEKWFISEIQINSRS